MNDAVPPVSPLRVFKGHGTENDFIVIPDLDGNLDLSDSVVRALCDRHAGIGADGVLRVVRSANDPVGQTMADEAPFFMDYRNADGSVAEMCGNGVRVFMRFLQSAGLAQTQAMIATRGGVRHAWQEDDGAITVEMGAAITLSEIPVVWLAASACWKETAIEVPNPHVVIEVDSLDALAELDLSHPPLVEPVRPEGQNVEFIVRVAPRQLAMRVHERGVGETRSCGTGICAAVVAAATRDGTMFDDSTWQVDVPGGRCQVRSRPDGQLLLTGPAVLVGEIELRDGWLAADAC